MKAELKHGWAEHSRRTIYETVEVFKRDAPASGQPVTGYGKRIPTGWMVRWGSRNYRVYAVCYSNVASYYIRSNGNRIFLDLE